MKLSVIIVNYNVEYFLEQCLYSVRKAMQHVDGEVFVVDNNSTDGSNRMVQRKFPEVHLVENKENLGFSKANNQVDSTGTVLQTGHYVSFFVKRDGKYVCARDMANSVKIDN